MEVDVSEKKSGGGQLIEDAERATIFKMRPEDVVIIGVDTDHGPEHPLYDERAFLPLKEETILSIQALGVLQVAKIVVMEIATKADKTVRRRAVCVDGRRRTLHSREANKRLRKVGEPEIIIRVEAENAKKISEEMLSLGMIAMNEREEDPVLVRAAKAERMLQRGLDKKKVAIAFGVTTHTIDEWCKIRSVTAPVRKALEKGTITPSAAAVLADLPKDEQETKLAELVASGAPTVAHARAHVKASRAQKKGGTGEVHTKPGGRLIRKILDHVKVNAEVEVSEDFLRGVRWVRGELDTKSVKGLSLLIKAVEKQKTA